jgi:hypothetical protein
VAPGDPVAWYLIEPGWPVKASDGTKVGEVAAVAGDEQADIFSGLEIACGRRLLTQKFVDATQVRDIVEGEITLSIDADGFARIADSGAPRA